MLSVERGADATSLDVSWAASEANGATITGYTVRWKPSAQMHYDSADQTDAGDLGATATEHTITGLTAGTEYTVQVRAEATVGADEADSAWAEATGTPAAAPAAPTLAAANIEAGHEQLVVSWEAPAASGATISGYTVRWQDSASPDVFDSADQATVTSLSYTITGLDNGTAYTVQVRADATIGAAAANSDWSSEASGTPDTSLAEAPDAPVVSIDAGHEQLVVSWEAPADNKAAITGYTVQWKSGDDVYEDLGAENPSRTHTTADAMSLSYTITGLTNAVEYTVQVLATNAKGNSPAAEASGTPASVPGMPTVEIVAGEQQLTVNWTAPAANHADGITGYTVQWKSGEQEYDAGASPSRHAEVLADAMSYTIQGLTGGVAYTVQVLATNAKGNSPAAEASGTPTAPPTAPPTVPPVVETVVETKTVDRVVYRTRSAPAPTPAPAPAGPSIIGDSGYATTYLAVDGQSIELRIHPHAGGPASHTFAVGSYVRDADLGQTYQIVAGGKRRWVSPDSPLVYAIPWPVVNSLYTFSSLVVAAIPLDESSPSEGFLVRGQNGRIVSYAMGAWRWVPNIPTFQALGYRWCDVNNADGGFFSRISEGSPHAATSQPEDPNYPVCG